MVFSDLLKPECVLVPLRGSTREEAIAALVGVVALPGSPQDREELKIAILAREKAGSTSLGNGIAIPHARTPRITFPLLAIGRASQPIDFNSADGKPVTLLFLLAVPAADPKSHLQVLAALSRMAADKKLLRSLNKAASTTEFYELVSKISI